MATEKEKIAIAVFHMVEKAHAYSAILAGYYGDKEINRCKQRFEHAKKQLVKVLPEYANVEELIGKDKKG